MESLKKLGGFLFSMKFAIIILAVFVLVCIGGSVISQGEVAAYYTTNYTTFGELILATGFDDVFHCWWFILLTAVLCLNLLGCNLLRFPGIVRAMDRSCSAEGRAPSAKLLLTAELAEDPEALFNEMGFRNVTRSELEGCGYRYAVRNKLGLWGAWLTHLGLLIVIVGFALGQIFTVSYTVYGVPGQTKEIGDTGLYLTIDSFDITLREDDTVEQYISGLTLTDSATGEVRSGETSVNHPLDIDGWRMYQNSTGWAADVVILENGELLQHEVLCVGEYTAVADLPELLVALRSFYPDYTTDSTGMPANASDQLNNPAYLYILYYQESVLGMNVLKSDEAITVEDYTILFMNPRMYTLIQIKHDPFSWLTLIGGIVLLLALFIAFYVRTEELWAVETEPGIWQLGGGSRKGGVLYADKLRAAVRKHNGKELENDNGTRTSD